MSVVERVEDPGQFTIPLDARIAPQPLLATIKKYGHIVICPQRLLAPWAHSDADILSAARYAGVVLEKDYDRADEQYNIFGQGMARHLGDADGNGPVLFENISYSAETVTNVLALSSGTGILPPAVEPGTITTTGVGTFTGDFEEADRPIDALRTVAAALNLVWRVNPNGTLDACLKGRDEVFKTTAAAIKYAVIRTGWGSAYGVRSVEATKFYTHLDGTGYGTRIVLVGEQFDGSRQITGFQDRASIPEKDIHGNELVWCIIVSQPPTDSTIDIEAWKQRMLDDWDEEIAIVVEALEEEFANGQAMVGDSFFVHDDPSVRDETNGVWHRGQYYPFKIIQATRAEWYLRDGMDVLYRDYDGVYTRLTPWVRWER